MAADGTGAGGEALSVGVEDGDGMVPGVVVGTAGGAAVADGVAASMEASMEAAVAKPHQFVAREPQHSELALS